MPPFTGKRCAMAANRYQIRDSTRRDIKVCETAFDHQFGLGSWHQHRGRDHQWQRPEFLDAGDVGERFAGTATFEPHAEHRDSERIQRLIIEGQQLRAAATAHTREQQFCIEPCSAARARLREQRPRRVRLCYIAGALVGTGELLDHV